MKKDGPEGLVGRYLDVKTKQAQDEAAILANQMQTEATEDFSVRRCISVLNTMVSRREEKIKASELFMSSNNGETFISFIDDDPETVLLWLRGKMTQF